MATAAIIEPEQLGSRFSGLLPTDRTSSSGSRKRSRCAVEAGELENACSGRNIYGDHVLGDVCGQASGQPMAADYAVSPLKRTLSFEVASLRAAASAAVAECTGSLGVLTDAHPARPSPMRSGRAHPASGGGSSLDSSQSRNEAVDGAVSSRHRGGMLSDRSGLVGPMSQLGGSSDPGHRPEEGLLTQLGCPPHGAKAICGRRPRMEDAYTAVPFLLEVAVPADLAQEDLLPPRIATAVKSQPGSPSGSEGSEAEGSPEAKGPSERNDSTHSASTSVPTEDPPFIETLHFFGVFDGHGGAEAALHCAQTLHQRIAEALSSASGLDESSMHSSGSGDEDNDQQASGQSTVTQRSARQPGQLDPESSDGAVVDELMDIALDDSGALHAGKVDGVTYTAARFESALTTAFNRTDEEFGKADNAALVGTTAVVTLVGSRQLYVANCGDSRAVLCRGGLAIPLTDDHKAAREDETARVEAAGGQILFWNGVRVMGVLAVSRAIGDHCLRPYVIAQPEVTILGRRADDELLLLASDGLWDVLSNQEACTLAKRCLRRARQRGASRQSAARIAATVLTRAAVDRGSRDNVTVLVVDLSSGSTNAEALARTTSVAYSEDGAGEAIENYDAGDNFGHSGSMRPGGFGYPPEHGD